MFKAFHSTALAGESRATREKWKEISNILTSHDLRGRKGESSSFASDGIQFIWMNERMRSGMGKSSE